MRSASPHAVVEAAAGLDGRFEGHPNVSGMTSQPDVIGRFEGHPNVSGMTSPPDVIGRFEGHPNVSGMTSPPNVIGRFAGPQAHVRTHERRRPRMSRNNSDDRNAAPRAGFTIPGAVDWSGLSRSALYRYAAEQRLIFRKAGRTTIVDGASLAALVESLPVAQIGAAKEAA
jgi:hypothetical protein